MSHSDTSPSGDNNQSNNGTDIDTNEAKQEETSPQLPQEDAKIADIGSSIPFASDEDNNPFNHQAEPSLDLDDEDSLLLYNSNDKNNDNNDKKLDKNNSNNISNGNGKENNGNITTGKDNNNGNANDTMGGTLSNLGSLAGFNTVHIDVESRVSKLLRPTRRVKVQITEAGNSNEGSANSSKKYVVYTIKLINVDDVSDEILTRRRYSDFESLRDVLTKIFPLVIIPPIPPKNYINLTILNGLVGGQSQNGNSPHSSASSGDHSTTGKAYSYINSTHLSKNKLIEHRKRLLGNFLNNCLSIPQIRNLDFFAKFLDPNANWVDEVSLITSQLPKSIYNSNPENGLKSEPIYASLPNPSNSHGMSFFKDNKKKIASKTNKLLANGGITSDSSNQTEQSVTSTTSEDRTGNSTYIINTSTLDDINKKIMENYLGLSNDYTELGTIFNTFSLAFSEAPRQNGKKVSAEEETKINAIFDKIGQIFDRSYITINALLSDLETKFSEPLGEAVQYSTILQFISKYQSRKSKQQDMVDSEIREKRKELQELLRSGEEANRIDAAVNSPTGSKNKNYDLEPATERQSASQPPVASYTSSKFKLFPSMNSLKKITQYVSEIIDQNPEETRKQRVLYLQKKIKTFEKCQQIMSEDVSFITDEVNKNFHAFHTKQLKMIFDILLCYNRFLIGWAKKNIDVWEEIREEIQNL
ncbi:predicted protein [Scheffersomyces stipitis CBS 6054]|uniref:PX domain-containing protein n=1 Tax=Scheffersomyces stipitis (strain ATCC 58785 / CBS 6054 / NBRC 10063 / NRRL Y-11545) TaxID=322104 RepID=A3LTP0_PICST|nr:predicted protein [Scheffersomyces stipitis CBS 6054]ABN66096.2 predicted protein [Scheffersomyces stipitis CBS 6054]